MSSSASSIHDAGEREKLIKKLEETVKNPALLKKAQQQEEEQKRKQSSAATATATAASSPTDKINRLRKWKESSFLYKFTTVVSTWTLLVVLLIMMTWARHMMDPLSHLIGYQLIVKDISVIDGDTFRAKVFPENIEAKFKLRLIDAPEMRQAYGYEASEILAEILSGGASSVPQMKREVIISLVGTDERADSVGGGGGSRGGSLMMLFLGSALGGPGFYYCDVVVRDSIFLNASSVQMQMVEKGAAWAYRGFHSEKRPSSLVVAMETAKKEKRGLWNVENQKDLIAPWDFLRSSAGSKAKQQQSASKKKKKGRGGRKTVEQHTPMTRQDKKMG